VPSDTKAELHHYS